MILLMSKKNALKYVYGGKIKVREREMLLKCISVSQMNYLLSMQQEKKNAIREFENDVYTIEYTS